MYNQVTFSKEVIAQLFSEKFFTQKEQDVLIGLYLFQNCKATAPHLAEFLGYTHFAPINSIVGKMGKKLAQRLNLELRTREDGTLAGWDVMFEGEYEGSVFHWKLKKPIVDALYELDAGRDAEEVPISEELPKGLFLSEGLQHTVFVNKFERNRLAREICIKMHGVKCKVCGFDFESVFGELGKGFIHVHHINPLAASQGRR